MHQVENTNDVKENSHKSFCMTDPCIINCQTSSASLNLLSTQHRDNPHEVALIVISATAYQTPPVLLLVDVGVAQRVIHAACHQLVGVVSHHLAHLVAVTLP